MLKSAELLFDTNILQATGYYVGGATEMMPILIDDTVIIGGTEITSVVPTSNIGNITGNIIIDGGIVVPIDNGNVLIDQPVSVIINAGKAVGAGGATGGTGGHLPPLTIGEIETIGNVSGGEIAGASSEGGRNSELGNKLDLLFGKATGSKHNIERSVAMENSLNRIGIYDNEYGREYLSSHLNKVLNDSSNISNIEVRSYIAKELPGCPEITYTAVTKESLLMGPYGGVKLESVWDGNRLLTVVIKGGN